MYADLFRTDPRSYALTLVEEGGVSAENLLTAALKYLSHDDCREMLDMNELSPRFDEDEPEDEDESEDDEDHEDFEFEDEDEVRAAFWAEHPEFADDYDEDKSQNDYNADIRTAFCDWVDSINRAGRISDDLAGEVTL